MQGQSSTTSIFSRSTSFLQRQRESCLYHEKETGETSENRSCFYPPNLVSQKEFGSKMSGKVKKIRFFCSFSFQLVTFQKLGSTCFELICRAVNLWKKRASLF